MTLFVTTTGDRAGGTATAVISAANEKAVEVFLAGTD